MDRAAKTTTQNFMAAPRHGGLNGSALDGVDPKLSPYNHVPKVFTTRGKTQLNMPLHKPGIGANHGRNFSLAQGMMV